MAYDGAMGPTVLEEWLKAAIDNAGSVGLPEDGRAPVVGEAADVPRRELTEEEVVGILRQEVDELDAGIAAAERHGRGERAGELRARHAVLSAYIGA